ncbi:hypothetical protein CsSME_00044854 [Camellia sinensis var. sinensis]
MVHLTIVFAFAPLVTRINSSHAPDGFDSIAIVGGLGFHHTIIIDKLWQRRRREILPPSSI